MSRLSGREIAARRREREAMDAMIAYVEKGDYKLAAIHLHCAESTLRRRLKDYMATGRYVNLVQAAYWLGRAEI